MILLIDISPEHGFAIKILNPAEKVFVQTERFFLYNTDRILKAVEKLLPEKDCIRKIKGIAIAGDGTFTSQRTAVVIANTLGYLLSVPVVRARPTEKDRSIIARIGKARAFKPIQPLYNKEPNITKPKKKSI